MQRAGGSHTRCIVLIEASEESGSPDLPAHLDRWPGELGTPSLVLCLDSGCNDYERLWVTTSLRGLAGGTLVVDILDEGVHSGAARGVVPSTFRIARQLLERVEDAMTGEIRLAELQVAIPDDRLRQAAATAADTPRYSDRYHFVPGAGPVVLDPVEQILNHTWRPTLSVVGADGLPPTTGGQRAAANHRAPALVPPAADVRRRRRAGRGRRRPHRGPALRRPGDLRGPGGRAGWNAPAFAPWLEESLQRASQATFGGPARAFGEGGTIPFMGMLGQRFPDAQFVITGVLGPDSNAHGPNEYLHLPSAERITAALAMVLDDHARR